MRKGENSCLYIFVKKISETGKALFTKEELISLWLRSGGSKQRISYALSAVIGRNILFRAARDIYIKKGNEDIDAFYWLVIKKLIALHARGKAYIAHEKSMEMYVYNYSIPQKLILYTYQVDMRLKFQSYQIEFRTLKSGKKTGMKNLFRIFEADAQKIMCEGIPFEILSIEATLLDVASIKEQGSGIMESLLLQFIQKYESRISRQKLGKLVSYRYIRALNRIRALTKIHGYTKLYAMSLDIIRNEGGGCFLNLSE